MIKNLIFSLQKSLPHAEVLEDVVEGFLGSNLATGDFGENVEDVAEILTQQVATETAVEAFEYSP